MGNKNSVNISDPTIKSYTQHPAGYIPNATSTVPRRNSFTIGVPPDSNTIQRSSTLMSTHVNHAKLNGNGKSVPNNNNTNNNSHKNESKNRGKSGIIHQPIFVNGKEEISRPGTNDSGYFTGYMTDSDKSERARLHGSRASLNEGIFAVPPPPQQPMHFYGPLPPTQMGPRRCNMASPFPPPDHFRIGMFPPPMESKKAKKWRKKQRKFISRHESLMSTLDAPFPMPPPFAVMHPPPHGPPASFNPMVYRAQSMDNLHMNVAPIPIPPNVPPPNGRFVGPPPRRFTSQTDLRFVSNHPQFLALPAIPPCADGKYDKKGKKLKEAKKDGSLKGSLLGSKTRHPQSSAPSSRSGRNSRNDEANTRFEEERILKPSECQLTHIPPEMDERKQNPPPDVIYETLKAARRSTLLTTADVEFEKKRETKENVMNISFERPVEPVMKATEESSKSDLDKQQLQSVQPPVVITPEAKAVMERNVELLANAENESNLQQNYKTKIAETCETTKNGSKEVNNEKINAEKIATSKPGKDVGKQTKDENETLKLKKTENDAEKPSCNGNHVGSQFQPPLSNVNNKMTEEKTRHSTSDSSDDGVIEAILNPVLLRKKTEKPQKFEPLEAWRDINIHPGTSRNQHTFVSEDCAVKENICVKLVPAPPSRRESHVEPIYLEYDERLPEFKKRLIETGSFDFPEIEKFHHSSQYSGSKAKDVDSSHDLDNAQSVTIRDESKKQWRTDDGNSNNKKNNDGSLKRLKESVANIFGTKSNDKLNSSECDVRHIGNQKINNERCLTPTTAKIKAGDSSDIDFSWVHDLETRFRREREQFERELETRKQMTLQRNGSLAHSQVSDHFRRQNDAVSSPRMDFKQFSAKEPLANGHNYKSTPQLNGDSYADDYRHSHATRSYSQDNGPFYGCGQQVENGYDHHSRNLQSPISNNVKNKAAMFESEAHRLQTEMETKHQQMMRQKNNNSRANGYRPGSANEEPIYIPKPDYDAELREANDDRMNRYLKCRERPSSRNNARRDYSPADDLKRSVNHNLNETPRGYDSSMPSMVDSLAHSDAMLQIETNHPSLYRHQSSYESSSPRSPCQKRLNRFYGPQNGAQSKLNGNPEIIGVRKNIIIGNENKFGNSYSSTMNGNGSVPFKGTSSSYNALENFSDPYVGNKNCEFVQRMNDMTANQTNGYSRMKGYENGFHAPSNDVRRLPSHYVSQPSFSPNDQAFRNNNNGHVPYSADRPLVRKIP